ncbi:hypothetical protein FXO38_04554 [Capsicum annuum]|nr:hypothetical protein FXO38_04554 [Capsicum annuum]
MVMTRSREVRYVKPLYKNKAQTKGRVTSCEGARGSVRARAYASARSSARGLSPEPCIENIGDMDPTLVSQSSSTLVIEGLLVCLLTRLEGAPLGAPDISQILSIVPLFVPDSTYGSPLISSRDPSKVPNFAFGTP